MSKIDWGQITREAANATDEHFTNQISGLTRLINEEIQSLIEEHKISKEDLAAVLKEVKDATKSNEEKANAIRNIRKGLDVLIAISGKFL